MHVQRLHVSLHRICDTLARAQYPAGLCSTLQNVCNQLVLCREAEDGRRVRERAVFYEELRGAQLMLAEAEAKLHTQNLR